MSHEFEAGEYARDKVQVAKPDEDAGLVLVLAVHDERADEYAIEALEGMTVHEAAYNWPLPSADVPEGYDAAADRVVEVAFCEGLDRRLGAAWVQTDAEGVLDLCERNDITTYTYHEQRLEPADPNDPGPRVVKA